MQTKLKLNIFKMHHDKDYKKHCKNLNLIVYKRKNVNFNQQNPN